MRRYLFLLAALLFLGAMFFTRGVSTSAAPDQSASLVLDWYPNSDHGGIFTALRRGYFAQRHIQLQAHVPSDTSAQITLVAAGRADFGVTYETDLLAARAHRIPVQSVMCIVQHPLDTVMALARSGITRPRDLVGKTIGMAGDPSDNPIVAAMMKADGASISQAHMVNVGYNLLPALLSGRVDAVVGVYWTWEALQAEQRGYKVNVMRVERWGVPNYCELVLIAGTHTIQTRPGYVRAVVNALQQGYAYAEDHPVYAWQALYNQDHTLQRGLVVRSIELLKPVITDAPTIGYQNATQWRAYAAWLWKNKLIARPVAAGGAMNNAFLQTGVH